MFRFTDFDLAAFQSAAIMAGGWVLILTGLLTLPTPAPVSTPAIAFGGMLLTRHSRRFRLGVAALRRRWPTGSGLLTRLSARWPRALRYVVLRTDPRRIG